MPIIGDLQVERRMRLYQSMSYSLRYCPNDMMLQVARLDRMPVACNERQVFALLVLKADLPAGEKLWSWLDFCKPWVLERSLQFTADDILEAVVRDDVVMCALVFDGDGLLHQAAFLEFVAVNQGPAEASLLIRCEALGKVGVYFVQGVGLTNRQSIECGILEFVVRCIHVLASLRNGRPGAFFSLAFGATGRIQRRLLLLRLQSSNQLPINEAVVHHSTWRPVDRISPALDARSVLLVH